MAVLVTAEVANQTREGYEGMLGMLAEPLRSAPGFILHAAHAVPGGWRIVEVWRSKEDSDRFFAKAVAPNLPPGIRPKRTVQELNGVLTPAGRLMAA